MGTGILNAGGTGGAGGATGAAAAAAGILLTCWAFFFGTLFGCLHNV